MKKIFGNKQKGSSKQLKHAAAVRSQSTPKTDNLVPTAASSTATKKPRNALPPHSSRDLDTAMEYLERYHTKFDGRSFNTES